LLDAPDEVVSLFFFPEVEFQAIVLGRSLMRSTSAHQSTAASSSKIPMKMAQFE